MPVSAQKIIESKPYCGFGAARLLWSCRDEEILMEGPAGTGKTRSILEKIHFLALKYKGMRALIARKTRESMTHTVLVTFEEKVVPVGFIILDGPKRNLRQSYRYPNGSEIVVGGLDNPMKIMSSEYDVIGLFESTEFTKDDFESLTTRLRNGVMPYQQIIVDCNPGAPSHWLNKRPEEVRVGTEETKMTRFLSRHEDNPVLYDQRMKRFTPFGERYIQKLENLSGPRKLRLRYGKWAAAEGIVYEEYDEFVHCIPKFKIPPTWRRIRSIDFGLRNPFVCQWWAIDNDGRMYLYREMYMSNRIVQDHAQGVRDADEKLVRRGINQYSYGEHYETTVADHDAEDRLTLDREGISTIPAYKDIQMGIEGVRARLRPDALDPEKKPRLFVFRDCLVELDPKLLEQSFPTNTMAEFDGYVYPLNQEGKPVKELPVDKDNHGMDALRYAVAYVDDIASMTLQVAFDETSVVDGIQQLYFGDP